MQTGSSSHYTDLSAHLTQIGTTWILSGNAVVNLHVGSNSLASGSPSPETKSSGLRQQLGGSDDAQLNKTPKWDAASFPAKYTIAVRIYQSEYYSNGMFGIVDKRVWHYANGGLWTEEKGIHILLMGGSGTSGHLRFKSRKETFIIALGVHNHSRWCDIIPNISDNDSTSAIQAEHYNGAYAHRCRAREQQLTRYSVKSATGLHIAVHYTEAEGRSLEAIIVIGPMRTVFVRVLQSAPGYRFETIRGAVWSSKDAKGSWSEWSGHYVLFMRDNDACGCLYLKSEKEAFVVVLGVHNRKRWCDIIPDLSDSQTAASILAEYTNDIRGGRRRAKEAQLAMYNVRSATGLDIGVEYTASKGRNLQVDVIIRMTYKVTVRINQHLDANPWYDCVEQTIWDREHKTSWSELRGVYTLTMEGSNASGCLVFSSNFRQPFMVALGVHNSVRWCDIVTDMVDNQEPSAVQLEYYSNKGPRDRSQAKESQLVNCSTLCPNNTSVAVGYTAADGHDLEVNIAIGLAYIISIRVHQLSLTAKFDIIEQSSWPATNGWWHENNDKTLKLTVRDNNSCGCLRFKSAQETFIVVFGIHDHRRWCDIVPNVAENQATATLLAQYYDQAYTDMHAKLSKQLGRYGTKSSLGTEISVTYTTDDGHNLEAKVVVA